MWRLVGNTVISCLVSLWGRKKKTQDASWEMLFMVLPAAEALIQKQQAHTRLSDLWQATKINNKKKLTRTAPVRSAGLDFDTRASPPCSQETHESTSLHGATDGRNLLHPLQHCMQSCNRVSACSQLELGRRKALELKRQTNRPNILHRPHLESHRVGATFNTYLL